MALGILLNQHSTPDIRRLLKAPALPGGFSLYGVRCEISRARGKKDLALFLSRVPARAAGVFTANRVKAAPVVLSRERLRSSKARAVLVNSGCANACTGRRGLADAKESAKRAAAGLGIPAAEVLVASTGVIGRFLPMGSLKSGIRSLVSLAKEGKKPSPQDAVRAIMTTDTRPKAALSAFHWEGKRFAVWGCAKGAGMIHPNMATMLSIVLTDVGLPAGALKKSLRWAAGQTFNRVSVDGDTSTNDSLFLLANGVAGDFPRPAAGLLSAFRESLFRVCSSLAEQIVSDGEGATRTAAIVIRGASSPAAAKQFAETVATSPLVKTALHGADPNWGRILAALGRSGPAFNPGRVEVRFGNLVVCRRGMRAAYSEKAAHNALKGGRIKVTVDLHQGRASCRYATCDLSKTYVAINADYTT